MSMSVRSLVLGFVAGALAVLVFHQGMVLLLYLMKQTPNFPWSMATMKGPFPVPALINQMFWGGLWGIVFAAFGHLIPVAHNIARGAIFGVLGPFLLGNGILVPLFRGTGQFFWTWPAPRYVIGGLIGMAFGIGLAVFSRAMNRG